jgi:hypothetical protein
MITDQEQLEELEFMETAHEYARNEKLWRSKTDYKAGEKASELDAKLWEMWSRSQWADRRTMAQSYNQFRLRLLYKSKTEA